MIKEAILKLAKKEDIGYEMAKGVMDEIMSGEASDIQMSAFLTAMSMKGETIEEITGCAEGMRNHCIKLLNNQDVLEIVGTGGDGSNSINISTIFNILGPLTNPAGANMQLLGVYEEALVEPLARVLYNLGVKNAMVVYGRDGMDEISMSAETYVCEVRNEEFSSYVIKPEDFGFTRCKKEDLEGGTPQENAQFARYILAGQKGAKTDAVLLNAGAAIHVAKPEYSIAEGIAIAKEILESGKAQKQLEDFVRLSNE